ncbi:enoyl-CoA hydratase/isomerase family protein [Antrihabitans sp. YC2-6]|uniref:enoyl-CoA hydratase/isomerase family protein n=1 Tax=Antrihabitans sp. YC2-6 TaxID=2799498 RepID=UPI0018F37AF8|nr:enoyl-CoA hydratase/isomerase family protein [Antrihabitans sp. YC2-6]MBJ8343658.1 enoyl-CoA hydratase/isomerase family protein [Antrihabitans sp. YC2-6]
MLELVEDGPVLRVWLNRPDSLNALDHETLSELADVFNEASRRFSVKVIVLGGRGRSFCAGADLKNPPGLGGETAREQRWRADVGSRACRAIADCEVVTIARLQGHVFGGGFALAQSCDFRIASPDATFALPEVDLGIPMTWGSVPRLIAEVGAARAREIVMLCDRYDAETAHRIGLVHRLVDSGQLDAAVDGLAEQIVAKPEHAIHVSKTQFRAYANALGDASFNDGDLFRTAISGVTRG